MRRWMHERWFAADGLLMVAALSALFAGCRAHAGASGESDRDRSADSPDAEEGSLLPPTRMPRTTSDVEVGDEVDALRVDVTRADIRVEGSPVVEFPLDDDVLQGEGRRAQIGPLIEAVNDKVGKGFLHDTVHFAVDRTTSASRFMRVYRTVRRCGSATYLLRGVTRNGRRERLVRLTQPTRKADVVPRREEAPLGLVVVVAPSGFMVDSKLDGTSTPIDGCPSRGATICLADDSVDVSSKIRKARKLLEQGDEEARASADELFREAERAYDWQSLYERLVRLKRRVPEAEVLKLGGVSDVPFGFLMRIMDVARYELEQETFESSESFRRALWNGETAMVDGEDGKKPKSMFDIVVVASPVR